MWRVEILFVRSWSTGFVASNLDAGEKFGPVDERPFPALAGNGLW